MGSVLTEKSLVLIFAYAPVGFGHLRVTDALYDGLPTGISPLLLGSQDQSITGLYRFISIHPITRKIMTLFQEGIGETIFGYFYKQYYRNTSKLLYRQLVTILGEQFETPKTVLVVATHFALAHQLAVITKQLEKEKNINIILVVQITDDSPQKLWYVDGADLIFSPSQHTKDKLLAFANTWHLKKTHIVVNSYPVSPLLSQKLSPEKWQQKEKQLDPNSQAHVHMMIPLSGAAVGTNYFDKLIREIHATQEHTWKFHIVAKDAPYTQTFFKKILQCSCVDLHVAPTDRDVINMYEESYQKEIIALEVTKPSEQAFKSLLLPKQVGGALLLFTEPVGRQEEDNIAFLQRHNLIPGKQETKWLWKEAKKHRISNVQYSISNELKEKVREWRGVRLPPDAHDAAEFILWMKHQGLFAQMLHKREPEKDALEVQSDGVNTFWEKVEEYVRTNH